MVFNLESSLFVDLDFYQSSNAELANLDNRQLLEHLGTSGLPQGRAFSPLVDLEFYQSGNSDLTGLDSRQLLEHLETYGVSEGRMFSPLIDLAFYQSSNPDLTGMDSRQLLEHLKNHGLAEGRSTSQVFDANFYRTNSPDLAAEGMDNRQLYEHFQIHGLAEGRAASGWFDAGDYLNNHADLAAQGFNYRQALQHFVRYGLLEGRAGSNSAPPDAAGNTLGSARNIALGTDTVTYRDAVGGGDAGDVYRFSLSTQSNLNLSLTGMSGDVDVQLLDAGGVAIRSSDAESIKTLLNPGTYYVSIYPAAGAGETLYNLHLSASPVAIDLLPVQEIVPLQTRITPEDLPAPFASNSVSNPAQVLPVPENPLLNVPAGFSVNVFAEALDRPRWLAVTPTGDVLVTETPQNRIRLLRDTNGDGVTDVQQTFAGAENGLNMPFGMAFAGSYFYVGNEDAVLRFPYTAGQEQIAGSGEKIADLPAGGHWTRNLAVSPDGQKLYVAIGSASNAEPEELPRASVQVMNLDGSNRQTFTSGLRNPTGLDFNPVTGQLYTTVNERDGLGNDLVPDYLTGLSQDDFYGWPYTYLTPDQLDPRRTQNGQSERPDLASRTQTPDVLFQAHSAPLGLQFYDGQTFPEEYRNGAFVAFRGSWNRDQGTGYKLVYAPFDAGGNAGGDYQDFLTGFLVDPAKPATWGRPTGLQVHRDGSLLFTEEENGRIYRIQYTG